jgi:hypothetical protein
VTPLCNTEGCTEPARWSVRVRAWALGHSRDTTPPATMVTPFMCCDKHRRTGKPDLFAAPGARAAIAAEFRAIGKAEPDLEHAEWYHKPLEPPKPEGPTVPVEYTCNGHCGTVDRVVHVRARGAEEDVVTWMRHVQEVVGADHETVAPFCPTRHADLKIPLPKGDDVRVGDPT